MLQKLEKLEHILQIKLDEDYVRLIENNILEKYTERKIDYFDPLKNKSLETSISTFFKPKVSYSGGLLLENDFYAPDELVENKLIPFGMDAGGYLFCFDYSKSHIPSIALWIRDNPNGKEIANIAVNFQNFLDKLESAEKI